jgi:hypothetical protein
MKLNNSLNKNFVIPAQAGIQQEISPRSEQNTCFVLLRRNFLTNWIPACAEMTAYRII